VHPQAPLARALADHVRTGRSRCVRALRPSGLEYEIETSEFFDLGGAQSPIDAAVLEHACGRVLDVGAGAGRHALSLQSSGHDVCAIDVSPICVELLRDRGVRDARVVDIWDQIESPVSGPLAGERFDTVLFGMQSIGIAGTLSGLDKLLGGLTSLLAPNGRLLLDSSAPHGPDFEALFTFGEWDGDDASNEADPPDAERLAGEALVSFSYRNWRGRFFPWLYLGASALTHAAARRGYRCEVLARATDSSEYLARLEPAVSGGRREAVDVYDPEVVPSAVGIPLGDRPREGRR
jgi:SAM-dependent methyltransferase